MTTLYRRIARNTALIGGGTAAAALFAMLAVALSARALDAREFGVLILLQSAALLLRGATSFSTQQPIIKLGSDAQAADDRQRLGEIISMGLIADLAASVLAIGVAAILIVVARDAVDLADQHVGYAWIFAGSLLLTGYPTSNGVFRLFNRFGWLSAIQGLSAFVLLLAAAALFVAGADLEAFVWVWAAYLALSSQLQLWFSLNLVRKADVPLRLGVRSFSGADAPVLLQYCWTTWAASALDTVKNNGDSLLVGAIVSVESAGIYNVAKQLAGLLRKFNVVFASTIFPEISRLAAQQDLCGAWQLKRRMTQAGLAVGAVAVAAAALVGGYVMEYLFGTRFAPGYVPLVILTAAAAGQLISHTPSMYVQVYRGPSKMLALFIISTAAFALAALPLTSAFGLTGMAVAQLLFAVVLIISCELALRGRKFPAPPADLNDDLSAAAKSGEG